MNCCWGLFGTAYDGAHAFERPKYGVQNIWNDHRGVVGAKQYGCLDASLTPLVPFASFLWGKHWEMSWAQRWPKHQGDSYIVLKDVRLRCTLSPQDSANLPARRPPTVDENRWAHRVMKHSGNVVFHLDLFVFLLGLAPRLLMRACCIVWLKKVDTVEKLSI